MIVNITTCYCTTGPSISITGREINFKIRYKTFLVFLSSVSSLLDFSASSQCLDRQNNDRMSPPQYFPYF